MNSFSPGMDSICSLYRDKAILQFERATQPRSTQLDIMAAAANAAVNRKMDRVIEAHFERRARALLRRIRRDGRRIDKFLDEIGA